ncbi:hypothetical protein [Hymenobacter rubripertinctus]|uniref:Uncharacterized protein n=1 Tax=Hymenobacter rubripertinctus TaxID=2029981 RepID=A0A418QUI1_9BACT|nr:hypothetical protein [Hymenobacter rubripertinctus]RIY08620.1 hypothetical protein D0T11_13990 [Hymenobacter rubripertinctus]
MPITLSLLTTRAECDEALADLNGELDGYQQRTSNLDYADRRTERTQADVDGRLAGAEAEIAAYEAIMAAPNLTPTLRRQTESKLRRANDRRDNLNDRGGSRSGVARLLSEVDADQVVAQVAVLTAVIGQVTTHRAALPA